VRLIFDEEDWQVQVITKSACAIVDVPYHYQKVGGRYYACEKWRKSALGYIASLSPDAVLIGSSIEYKFSEEEWEQGTLRILESLSAAARDVYVIAGTPRLGVDGPGCASRNAQGGVPVPGSCASPLHEERPYRVRESLQRAVNVIGNAHLIRVDDIVCPGRDCRAVDSHGVVVFRDSTHLTDSFVRSVSDQLADQFLHHQSPDNR